MNVVLEQMLSVALCHDCHQINKPVEVKKTSQGDKYINKVMDRIRICRKNPQFYGKFVCYECQCKRARLPPVKKPPPPEPVKVPYEVPKKVVKAIDVYRKLDAAWHENFSCRFDVKIEELEKTLKEFEKRMKSSGFWFTTDKYERYVRCGAQEDISSDLKGFEVWPNETYMYICLGYWMDKLHIRSMKQYKQAFKRELKSLEEHGNY